MKTVQYAFVIAPYGICRTVVIQSLPGLSPRNKSPAAPNFRARITKQKIKLAWFFGREVPEAEEREDVRELIFQGYRIIYLRQTNRVYIVAVIHGSQDLSGIDNKPWDVG